MYLWRHARPVPASMIEKLSKHHCRHQPNFIGLRACGQTPEKASSTAFWSSKHLGVRRLRRRTVTSDRRHEGAKNCRIECCGSHYNNAKALGVIRENV